MTRSSEYDFTIPSSPWLWLMNLGLILIVAGTAMPLIQLDSNLFRYIYTVGAAIAMAGRIAAPKYRGTIVRIIRLSRIEFWSCVAFCAGAFFMWYNQTGARDWLAFTLAGGVLQVYASLMTSLTMKKELKSRHTTKP